MSRNWRGGSTRAWRRVRALVLARTVARNGGQCEVGLPGCTGVATQAHHTHGRSVTGDDPRYMVGACAHCNTTVGDPGANPDPAHTVTHRW